METTLPTGRPGRVAALGIAIIILGFIWLMIISPLIGFYQDRQDKIRQQSLVAAHMAALAEELPGLRDQAAAAAEQDQPIKLTIEGSSDAVAAAALQTLLQEMASGAGANLSSIENVPAEATGAYRRVGLKLSFDAPWAVLVNLLAKIDRANPPMFVDNLEVHASPVRTADQPLSLDVGLTVYALRAAASEGSP